MSTIFNHGTWRDVSFNNNQVNLVLGARTCHSSNRRQVLLSLLVHPRIVKLLVSYRVLSIVGLRVPQNMSSTAFQKKEALNALKETSQLLHGQSAG